VPSTTDDVASVAKQLFDARTSGEAVEMALASITAADGYLIQSALLARHLEAGDTLVGYKIGLTSPAARASYATHEPVWGFLLSSIVVSGSAARGRWPGTVERPQKVEAELAFVLAEDLRSGVSAGDVVDATRQVFLAAEIVESRWHAEPGLGALIADDVSNAAVVLGPEVAKGDALSTDSWAGVRSAGRAARGTSADVFGAPASAVAWLATALARSGRGLRAGDLVMSGSFCAPLPVAPPDDVIVDFGRLGVLHLSGGSE
jgi:2-keto-4-pentenoate hydratase